METRACAVPEPAGEAARLRRLVPAAAVLVPAAAYAAVALHALATDYWGTEQGAHGPLILASGAWLLWRQAAGLAPATPSARRDAAAATGIAACGLLGVLAAVLVKPTVQVAASYAALVFLLYRFVGGAGLRRLRAPLAYLLFLIPPPEQLVVPLTHALKGWVARHAVNALFALGYPVAKDGPTLYIGPYELVVAAACSGMNSLVSLSALGLFYIYLMRPGEWRYGLVLAALIVPIAVLANLVRVIAILLATFHFGEAAGLGVLHDALGLVLFAVALGLLAAADRVLHPLLGPALDARARRSVPAVASAA